MIVSLILPLLVNTRPVAPQNSRDYPLQIAFDYEESNRVTALALVECLDGGTVGSRRFEYGKPDPGEQTGSARSTLTQRVRVVDSSAIAPETVVQVVAAGNSMSATAYRMRPGNRYLVLAALPRAGRLEIPHSSSFDMGTDTAYALPGELSGLAVFETHASSLASVSVPADRIANSVVDCVQGSDAANVHRIAQWLEITGYPGGGRYNNIFGRDPFPLSQRIRDLTASASAYTRYELFNVLCEWHVFGSEQGWVDAIIDLADEEKPFLPGDTFLGGELQFSKIKAANDSTYAVARVGADRWADALSTSKNDAVRSILLNYIGRICVVGIPDEGRQKALAQALLASPNPSIVEGVVGYFSAILKRPDLAPKRQNVNGNAVWTNREASLAALRARFGLPSGS